MINRTFALALVAASIVVSGCSRTDEYAPEATASGEAIFQTACVGCHEAVSEGVYFELSADAAKPAAIAEKVSKGSLAMPGFPNIQGEQLTLLSEYVASVSAVK